MTRGTAGRGAVIDLARGSLNVAPALAEAGSGEGVGISTNRTASSVSTRPVTGGSAATGATAAGRGVTVRGWSDGALGVAVRGGAGFVPAGERVVVRGVLGLELVRARVAAGVLVP